MIHAVPNRRGNAITTSALIQGATYVQSGWQGDLLTQCSPSPAIPYPCFDLSSARYGTLNTTTGAFTSPQVPDVAGLKSLASFVVQVPVAHNPNGTEPITGTVYSHVCTGTNGCGLAVGSAPTSTAQLVIQGPAFAPTTQQVWTRAKLNSGLYRPKPLKAWIARRRRSRATTGPGHTAPTAGRARQIPTGSV